MWRNIHPNLRRRYMPNRHTDKGPVDYRKVAFAYYRDRLHCVWCGFGIPDVLEVAHLDGSRKNNGLANLVILCPTCHKMLDLDLISTAMVADMRDRPRIVRWSKRMKNAGRNAANSRKRNLAFRRRRRHLAALKAAATRALNLASSTREGSAARQPSRRVK